MIKLQHDEQKTGLSTSTFNALFIGFEPAVLSRLSPTFTELHGSEAPPKVSRSIQSRINWAYFIPDSSSSNLLERPLRNLPRKSTSVLHKLYRENLFKVYYLTSILLPSI